MEKGLKFYYHFDFGDDWLFEIRKNRRKPTEAKSGVKYPRVLESAGPNPPQYGEWDELYPTPS